MTEIFWECEVCGIEAIDEYEKKAHIKETRTDRVHQVLRTETSVFDEEDGDMERVYL